MGPMRARADLIAAIVVALGCTVRTPESAPSAALVPNSQPMSAMDVPNSQVVVADAAAPAPGRTTASPAVVAVSTSAPVVVPATRSAPGPLAEPPPDLANTSADAPPCDRGCEGGDQRGDDLLTPIDRAHGLLPTWEPEDLVALDPPYVIAEGSPPNLVRRAAADAFVALSDAAFAATGVRVNIRSGYRPFALQCGIFRAEVARQSCVEATRSSARAGFSEHQLGTTVDVAVGWRRLDGAAPIDAWLRDHAHEHGWVLSYPEDSEAITGYKHEPWHFRYLGPDAARAHAARSEAGRRLTVEEFLGAYRPRPPAAVAPG